MENIPGLDDLLDDLELESQDTTGFPSDFTFDHVFVSESEREQAIEKQVEIESEEELLFKLIHTLEEYETPLDAHGNYQAQIHINHVHLGNGSLELRDHIVWRGQFMESEKQFALPASEIQSKQLEDKHLVQLLIGHDSVQFCVSEEDSKRIMEWYKPQIKASASTETLLESTVLLEARHKRDTIIKEAYDHFLKIKMEAELEYQRTASLEQEETCQLCFDNTADQILMPCMHKVCVQCKQEMQKAQITTCPWDRVEIKNLC